MIPPKESQQLQIRFMSTDVGKFQQVLNFEAMGITKMWKVNVSGETDYPKLLGNVVNVFANRKKAKPTREKSVCIKTFFLKEQV